MIDDVRGFCAVVSRRSLVKASSATLGSLVALVAMFAGESKAHAQQKISGEFSVQRFDPAPGPRNFFVTRTARSDGNNTWSAGLVFDYASKPLVIQSCVTPTDCASPSAQFSDIPVVKSLMTTHLLASFTPKPFLQMGLTVPLTYVSGSGLDRNVVAGPANGAKAFAIGDPALEAKFRFLGAMNTPLALAAAGFITAPTAQATTSNPYIGQYVGDGSVTGGLRAIGDFQIKALTVAGNLVGILRQTAQVGDAKLGNEVRYSVAVGYQVSPTFRAVFETYGNSRFVFKSNGSSAMEGLLGAQFVPLSSRLSFMGGLGMGILNGVGAPGVRGFIGASFTHENHDKDADGISDEQDQCPDAAEDRDDYQDSDGCPEPDNDGDGVLDVNDKCPNEAEDMDGFEDMDGCPDVDNDKDGVPDDADHCPLKPETKNGFKDEDGCPDELDQDGDGVPDARDKCPTEVEDTDGFQDEDGCPDLDNDNDGVPDDKDECIDEPETQNGFQDEDGCPDEDPKKK